MSKLDPGLVVHTLKVDPEAKPVAQPTRIFHNEIKGANSKGSAKVVGCRFH